MTIISPVQSNYVNKNQMNELKEFTLEGFEKMERYIDENTKEIKKFTMDGFEKMESYIDTGVRTIGNRIGNIEDKVGNIENKIGSIENKVENIENKIGTIENRMDHLEKKMDQNKVEIVEQFNRTAGMIREQFQHDLQLNSEYLVSKIDAIDKKLDKVIAR